MVRCSSEGLLPSEGKPEVIEPQILSFLFAA